MAVDQERNFRLIFKWVRSIRILATDSGGNFAIMFSLMAPVLIVILGMGLDYLNALSHKTRWDSSADAAALKADQVAAAYAQANTANQSYTQLMQNAETAGIAAAIAAFNANSGASSTTGSVTPTVTMSYAGTKFTSVVSYTASIATYFGGLVGNTSIGIQGNATATQSLTTYINYYILVDISQSMGIGSTQTDMSNLYTLTKSMGYSDDGEPGCVFGCHVPSSGRPLSNEQVAHQAGINLRIDAAKTAIQDVITSASTNAVNGNIKVGLYTMWYNSSSASSAAVTVSAPSNAYSSLTTAASSIDLAAASGGDGESDMQNSIANFAQNILPSNGTGISASSPLNYVFVITDGLTDLPGSCNIDGHCDGVMSSTACQSMQQKATVGVIYTTYLPIYQNNDATQGYDSLYTTLVLPSQPNIPTSLQQCASGSQYYFQADDGPSLIAYMNQLFASTQSSLQLTH